MAAKMASSKFGANLRAHTVTSSVKQNSKETQVTVLLTQSVKLKVNPGPPSHAAQAINQSESGLNPTGK